MSSNPSVTEAARPDSVAVAIPHESLARLFVRFLKFGAMAWGGPVAQIAMLRRSLVEDERWITPEHFNRVLALYQVLPGPEAHEMCVYFGMLARGRVGGMLAGAAFMLPGFCLMFLLSWMYVRFGLDMHGAAALFSSIQAGVVALIVRAVHRIGSHVLFDAWAWAIAVLSFCGHLLGVHFAILLLAGGVAYGLRVASRPLAIVLLVACAVGIGGWLLQKGLLPASPLAHSLGTLPISSLAPTTVSLLDLFWSGLKAGALTFGGAYTAIPFLQRDAVNQGAWMTNGQFMDGVALSGLLPAPLIIFSTFVGYIGGGAPGAILMTIGVFLPAFAFTLIAHDPLERLISHSGVRALLDGVTAAVVGLIAATALVLLVVSVKSALSLVVFLAAVAALFYWNHKLMVPLVVAGAMVVGLIAMLLT
jgi:chromate transporter